MWLELRRSCNFNCKHCYLDSDYQTDKNLEKLTLDEWKSVIMELNNYNVSKIILIGGEPLMFDGINKLVLFVRKIFPNAKIVLYSNLTLLEEEKVALIKKLKQ